MKKLLIITFLLISSLIFSQPNNYENLAKQTTKIIQVIDNNYQVEIQETETDFIFIITNNNIPFTKYDNISISSLIYRYLLDTPIIEKTIKIITPPYTREVTLIEDVKSLKNSNNKRDLINESQVERK